ncbi:aspartic peptidase domain-containing protein [Lasiosphaeris hirsuta]|uniref:Aspartic peptidase domain-containing protein n=1 Tax=Lasiosphaeris hirsuta TaxID=260670 RepID=A0AA40BDF9_9PEZI|nr:aspartic peptidase domain-containing protein [Lasiosphaeris hirsuta]
MSFTMSMNMLGPRRLVVAAALAALINNSHVAASDCSNSTFAIPLRNCTFASGVVSWGNMVEVGTPPQRLCLVPSTVINSTLVSQESLCMVSNTLEPHKCEGLRGGFFNENSSSTWTGVSLSAFNDTRSNPIWEHFNAPGFTQVGYDTINFPNENVALYGAGIALNQYGNDSNAGMIGLGKDSVFLADAVRQGRAGSKGWSLDAGSQSVAKPRDGELVVGGYNAGRTDGSFSWSNVSDMRGDRPCPLRTKITHMSVTLANGESVPIMSNAEVVDACIEPYDNLFRFTPGMLLNWKSITGFNESLDVYSSEGARNMSFNEYGLSYDSSRVDDWSLAITLDNGYKTTVPAHELQRPLLGFDNVGNRRAVPGVTNMQILNEPTGDGEVPTLGKIFLSRSYLGVDYDNGRFGLAQAATITKPDKYASFACHSASGATTSSPPASGTPTATIVGSVIGSLSLVASAVALLWWVRHRKQRQKLLEGGMNLPGAQLSVTPPMQLPSPVHVAEMYSDSRPMIYYLPSSNDPQELHGLLSSPRSGHGMGSPCSPRCAAHWSPHAGSPHWGMYEVAG